MTNDTGSADPGPYSSGEFSYGRHRRSVLQGRPAVDGTKIGGKCSIVWTGSANGARVDDAREEDPSKSEYTDLDGPEGVRVNSVASDSASEYPCMGLNLDTAPENFLEAFLWDEDWNIDHQSESDEHFE